jgi:hypothetical protein
MGDKSPKSAKKNQNQKQSKDDATAKKKKAAVDAKIVPKATPKK